MRMEPNRYINKYILLVDDDPDILKLYSDYLQLNGFNILSFENPFAALNYLENKTYNCSIVITDYRMNGMSGIDLINKIHEKNNGKSSIKFVLLSAFLKEDFILDKETKSNNITKKRIDLVLEKPIALEKLKMSIAKLLDP